MVPLLSRKAFVQTNFVQTIFSAPECHTTSAFVSCGRWHRANPAETAFGHLQQLRFQESWKLHLFECSKSIIFTFDCMNNFSFQIHSPNLLQRLTKRQLIPYIYHSEGTILPSPLYVDGTLSNLATSAYVSIADGSSFTRHNFKDRRCRYFIFKSSILVSIIKLDIDHRRDDDASPMPY